MYGEEDEEAEEKGEGEEVDEGASPVGRDEGKGWGERKRVASGERVPSVTRLSGRRRTTNVRLTDHYQWAFLRLDNSALRIVDVYSSSMRLVFRVRQLPHTLESRGAKSRYSRDSLRPKQKSAK